MERITETMCFFGNMLDKGYQSRLPEVKVGESNVMYKFAIEYHMACCVSL